MNYQKPKTTTTIKSVAVLAAPVLLLSLALIVPHSTKASDERPHVALVDVHRAVWPTYGSFGPNPKDSLPPTSGISDCVRQINELINQFNQGQDVDLSKIQAIFAVAQYHEARPNFYDPPIDQVLAADILDRASTMTAFLSAKKENREQLAAAQKEQQMEARSALLTQINTEYPGLADRFITGTGFGSLQDNRVKLSKFIVCMEYNKDAAEWNVSRDRSGVHVSGLLYQQSVVLEFIDHGDHLEIVEARYGERVSLTESDANRVLQELVDRCN